MKSINASFSSTDVQLLKGEKLVFDTVETFNVINFSHKNHAAEPNDFFSFKCLKKLTVKLNYCDDLDIWLDFILAHPTIKELEIQCSDSYRWDEYLDIFESNHEKLIRMSQNVERISLNMINTTFEYFREYYNQEIVIEYIYEQVSDIFRPISLDY